MKNNNTKISNNLSFYIEKLQAMKSIEEGRKISIIEIEEELANFTHLTVDSIQKIKYQVNNGTMITALKIHEYISNQFEDIEIQFTDIFNISDNSNTDEEVRLFVYELKGLNYYVLRGSKTINITTDDVNNNNYNDVRDINVIMVNSKIEDYQQLENIVVWNQAINTVEYELNECLELRSDLNYKQIQELTNNLSDYIGFREQYILATMQDIEIDNDNNTIVIYNEEEKSFAISITTNQLGKIVN